MTRSIVLLACALCACSAAPQRVVEPEVQLNADSAQLDGWMSTRGEWILFSSKDIDFRHYNPVGRQQSQRCVSMVNDTGKPRDTSPPWKASESSRMGSPLSIAIFNKDRIQWMS